MARKSYARRYSQAVFDIARERNELDRWQSDLERLASLVADANLMALMASPKVPFSDKTRLLSEWLRDVSPLALNLAHLLVARGKLGIAAEVAGEYRRLLDSYRGIEPAEVTTAVALDDEDKKKLAERLGAVVGKRVVLKTTVEPGVIGGIVARVGGKLLDGSTRSRLLSLKKQLTSGEVR